MSSSSRPPENENLQPPLTVDQFLGDLTNSEKEILTRFLALDPNDLPSQSHLIREYGETFTRLAFQVQQLVQGYGCGFDAIRRLLLERLEKEGLNLTYRPEASSTRASVSHLIDPYAPTEHSSEPPPHPYLQAALTLLEPLSPDQLQVLYEDCSMSRDTSDKTQIPVIRPIVIRLLTQLEEQGLHLPTKEMRELIYQATVIAKSKKK